MTGAPAAAGAEKGMPVRIRSSPATVSGAQAIMSLTQVGKALRAMKLSQETCLLRSSKPTGDRLALVCVNIEFGCNLHVMNLPQGSFFHLDII